MRIRGRVQGVGYRASMTREARRLGLSGWVRNRLDGSVEGAAVGDDDAVAALVEWAHRGPPAARVTEVEARPLAGPSGFEGFEQLPTA
nr:acylphosphatase [Quisquiliibacterium transsilvanicum]